MTPPTDLSARRGGFALRTTWKNSTSGPSSESLAAMIQIPLRAVRRRKNSICPRERDAFPRAAATGILPGRRVVSEPHLALILGRGVADHPVAGAKDRRVISEPHFALVPG